MKSILFFKTISTKLKNKMTIGSIFLFVLVSALLLILDMQMAYAWSDQDSTSSQIQNVQAEILREHLPGAFSGTLKVHDTEKPKIYPCEVTWSTSASSDFEVNLVSSALPIHTVIVRDFFGRTHKIPTPDFSKPFHVNFVNKTKAQYKKNIHLEYEVRSEKNHNIIVQKYNAIYEVLFNPLREELKVKVQVLISNGISSQLITNNTSIFTCSK